MAELPNSPTRRSVMRASTWSVPVLAVAAAAPAFAASNAIAQCGTDDILSLVTWPIFATSPNGNAVRATNTGSVERTYEFTQVASEAPFNFFVRNSYNSTVTLQPSTPGDHTFPAPVPDPADPTVPSLPNGGRIVYLPGGPASGPLAGPLSGTFKITIQPNSFLEFAADRDDSAGCNASTSFTVTSVDCELVYIRNQCAPI